METPSVLASLAFRLVTTGARANLEVEEFFYIRGLPEVEEIEPIGEKLLQLNVMSRCEYLRIGATRFSKLLSPPGSGRNESSNGSKVRKPHTCPYSVAQEQMICEISLFRIGVYPCRYSQSERFATRCDRPRIAASRTSRSSPLRASRAAWLDGRNGSKGVWSRRRRQDSPSAAV
jgi:hypothetical protein